MPLSFRFRDQSLLITGLCLGYALTSQAQDHASDLRLSKPSRGLVAKTEGSELSIDPNLVDKLFEASVSRPSPEAPSSQGLTSGVEYAYFKPHKFVLKNKYFVVPHEKNTSNLNLVTLAMGVPITSSGPNLWQGFFSLGYAHQQDIYTVQAKTGLALRDTVSLSWMPLLAGVDFERKLSSTWFRPGFRLAAGADWISQNGQLDGMQQVFWVPHLLAGPQLVLFPRRGKTDGFDGIALAALYHNSLASTQQLSGWSANVGTRYAF